jgi:ribosomal protein L40E
MEILISHFYDKKRTIMKIGIGWIGIIIFWVGVGIGFTPDANGNEQIALAGFLEFIGIVLFVIAILKRVNKWWKSIPIDSQDNKSNTDTLPRHNHSNLFSESTKGENKESKDYGINSQSNNTKTTSHPFSKPTSNVHSDATDSFDYDQGFNLDEVYDSPDESIPEMGKKCTKCGSPVFRDFCGNCGMEINEPLQDLDEPIHDNEMTCTKCQFVNPDGSNFCRKCGKPL